MKDTGKLLNSNTVQFERLLPGPIERVWAYLVESDKRKKWLCGGTFDLKVGGLAEMHFSNSTLTSAGDAGRPVQYKDRPKEVAFSGEITQLDPPTLLAYTWTFGDVPSEVRYELSNEDDQVLLRLTHTRLVNSDALLSVSGGWHTHLDILVDIMNGREPKPFWATHTRNSEYYEKNLNR